MSFWLHPDAEGELGDAAQYYKVSRTQLSMKRRKLRGFKFSQLRIKAVNRVIGTIEPEPLGNGVWSVTANLGDSRRGKLRPGS